MTPLQLKGLTNIVLANLAAERAPKIFIVGRDRTTPRRRG